MANYGLAANTVFKNRSFEDLLRPLAMYTEEYNTQEGALNELETKASVWENMANEQTDPIAYAQYKRYADDLKNQAVSLANNRLTPSTRRDILNLRKRYASEIAPIEQAFANRKQQADEQRKALLQNPTLLLSRRADMTSLDDYLANPELGYDQYSGAMLTSQVGTAAQALAKELRDYGNGKPLDGFTKTWIQQHGFTKEDVARAINDPYSPRSSKVLNTLVEGVMADSGIPQWADRNTLAQAYAYARQGLWQAVGQTNVTPYTDEAAKMRESYKQQKELIDYQLNGGKNGPVTGVNPDFDTRNVRTSRDIEEEAKDREMWNKYGKKYFRQYDDGRWYINDEGQELYLKPHNKTDLGPATKSHLIHTSGEISTDGDDFYNWLNSKKLSGMGKGMSSRWHTEQINNMLNRINNILDVHSDIEYTEPIAPSNYDNVISMLNHISDEDGKVDSYTRNRNDNGYEVIAEGDKVEVNNLTTSDIKSAHIVFGDHGDFLEVKTKDGIIVEPFGLLSPTYSTIVAGNRDTVRKYREAEKQGYTHLPVRPGVNVPITDLINSEINSWGKNLLSSIHVNKIKDEEVETGYYGTR